MSLKKLPQIKALKEPSGYSWDVPSDALARWSDTVSAAKDEPNTITIYDPIGEDPWDGSGFTAKRMAGALRSIGQNDVTVKINSPGGSVFEGFAIYNELANHPAKVTVEVMGIAASAAAYIAMAGDDIRMGLGTFIMVTTHGALWWATATIWRRASRFWRRSTARRWTSSRRARALPARKSRP
jgi:ATP-dependent protease ClpP protease subunit